MSTNELIENDWDAEERRAYERYSVEFYLCVYNRDTDTLVGHIVDISLGGIQLLSETPIANGEQFRFRMDVSLESGRKETIDVEAQSVWHDEDVNPGLFNTGFEFLTLSPVALKTIKAIIKEIAGSV
ncbi:MAG TPA: hypothetical protein DIC59_06785 [Candidatus Competibacteraceae bacterium]|nr:hypothetical protein [Candidatus Competibacteraceae bacterium]